MILLPSRVAGRSGRGCFPPRVVVYYLLALALYFGEALTDHKLVTVAGPECPLRIPPIAGCASVIRN
jgi:hypothetical protein